MATNAGQNMDGSSYKLSQQPRWNVTMCKQKIASICKTSIQSISGGFSSCQFQQSSFQTNNIKGTTDSDAHQKKMAFAPDLIPQALTKLEEENLFKFM